MHGVGKGKVKMERFIPFLSSPPSDTVGEEGMGFLHPSISGIEEGEG